MRVRGGLALLLVAAVSPRSHADDSITVDKRWPGLPAFQALSLEDQITDHLTELGNLVGSHVDVLSHDMIGLHVNGRANRARLRLGGGNDRYLTFRLDSDWLFAEGKARVNAHVELGLHGHMLDLQLPAMDVIPDSYHGQQLVQVNVPLLERHF
ncbi:MAG: hypothetical protein JWO36_6024 [Myxococcales bacterium]|nr:hypothetical protein [Myxococcales bacterium]